MPTLQDFIARMRTETGVSSGTTASSDWEENTENKTRIQVAKTIVETAVAGAVDTLQKVSSIIIALFLSFGENVHLWVRIIVTREKWLIFISSSI